ncbi:MAG: RibD family protein [Candidatus Thermoplasmatota archaeon]
MRPTVWLNCAASLDGKLAAPDRSPMVFSDDADWHRVHRMRSEVDAILVGVGTILADNPSLTIKDAFAPVSPTRHLLRVILDSKGRTPKNARAVDGYKPSLIVTAPGVQAKWAKAQHATVPLGADGHLDLGALLNLLYERGVRRLLVEGGSTVLRSFLDTDYVDRWTLYVAPVLVGGNGPSLFDGRPSSIGRRLHVENVQAAGKGALWTFRP